MKKSRFSEEQIISLLKQAEARLPIKELGGFSDATFYKWRAKFGGMDAPDAKRLRELEGENAKLKKLLAEAHLSERRACSLVGPSASAARAPWPWTTQATARFVPPNCPASRGSARDSLVLGVTTGPLEPLGKPRHGGLVANDQGESFGPYTMGQDEALLRIVSSANVACGFHAGGPLVMDRTVANARASGVGVGAHPGFMDLQGFGRRQIPVDDFVELEKMVVYQIGALMAISRARGHRVTHVKFHGGLAHMAFASREVAETVARAVVSVDPKLILLGMPHTETESAAQKAGLTVAREIFADRMYDDNGRLRPRKLPGAVIQDPGLAAERVVRMLEESAVLCASGKRIPTQIDSVCVHGDTPGTVAIAQAVRHAVQKAGFTVRSLHETIGTPGAASSAR